MRATDCVLDASALVLALNGKSEAADALRERLPGTRLHAPYLIDAEVGNVLRRHERAGRISTDEAHVALRSARLLVNRRYQLAGPLAERAWELRANLTFYDALYVALASRIGAPLVTGDARLCRSPGLPCAVDLV